MRVLVTGGAGFIGSAVVNHLLRESGHSVVNVDRLDPSSDLERLSEAQSADRYAFERVDVCDVTAVQRLFKEHLPEAVVHLAAERRRTRGTSATESFVRTNVGGPCAVFEASLDHYRSLAGEAAARFRVVLVSTGEVYGSVPVGSADPLRPLRPTSPYAASKASADLLAAAWHHTWGLPIVIARGTNNYGPWQNPHSFIPMVITRALCGQEVPVYGDGQNVRDWVHVGDHARALRRILERGQVGATYHVSTGEERKNIDVVTRVCQLLDELVPESPYRPHQALIRHVPDRRSQDRRYSLDSSETYEALGWRPRVRFADGLRHMVDWYASHRNWWASPQA